MHEILFIGFLFGTSLSLLALSVFLFHQKQFYQSRYFQVLLNPNSQFHVECFFQELTELVTPFDAQLNALINTTGCPITSPPFQFRFALWWKFFGPSKLENAIAQFNDSPFLHPLLKAPKKKYSSRKFLYFVKKLGITRLQELQTQIIQQLVQTGWIKISQLILDSFPVKSVLNVQKCLRRPKIDYIVLKKILANLQIRQILEPIQVHTRSWSGLETKVKALLIKELWDLFSWQECWNCLFGKEALKHHLALPKSYKSVQSLKGVQSWLASQPNANEIEQTLVIHMRQILIQLQLKPSSWRPQTIVDLNTCWYRPHRLKDPGISFYHCAAKNLYAFGRGGLIAVIKSLELPIFITLTPKYKQSRQSILRFVQQLFFRFSAYFEQLKILGDSEFGFPSLRTVFERIYPSQTAIPNYGNSREKIPLTAEDKKDRKLVERVIARLVVNWNLETPQHRGVVFAEFHLQLAVLCDLLQVYFNLRTGNYGHPHAIKTIRGKRNPKKF